MRLAATAPLGEANCVKNIKPVKQLLEVKAGTVIRRPSCNCSLKWPSCPQSVAANTVSPTAPSSKESGAKVQKKCTGWIKTGQIWYKKCSILEDASFRSLLGLLQFSTEAEKSGDREHLARRPDGTILSNSQTVFVLGNFSLPSRQITS